MHSRNILTVVTLVFALLLFVQQVCAVPLLGDKQQRQAKKLWKEGKYLEAIALMRKRCTEKKEIKELIDSIRDLKKLVKKMPKPVVKEIQDLCNKGDADGCADMGWYLFSKNNGLCVQYFRKACEYRDALSCNALGCIYSRSTLLKRNCTKCKNFLEKACSMGEMHGCYNLGILYKSGCGQIKRDEKQARQYFKKACKLGSKDACKELRPMWRKVLGF